MTSDFDNDEIQDSAFPVDFNDDTTSLDMYGVWVKSGPRDASLRADMVPSPSTKPEFSDKMPDYSDISLLPDLPDFSDLAESDTETDTEIEALDDGTITFEEILPDFSSLDELSSDIDDSEFDDNDTPSGVYTAPVPTETVSESEFDTLDTDSFFEMTETEDTATDSPFVSSFDSSEIVFEDIDSAELETSSVAPKKETTVTTPVYQESTESRVFESVDIFEMEDAVPVEAFMAEDVPKVEPEILGESVQVVEELSEFSDSPEFDLDDSFGIDLLSSDSETFELEEPSSFSTDTSDLDSFINDFNESGGTGTEDKDKLFSVLDPVDIDLDFDETFIADAEQIKATGSAVTKSEFLESEFGVEMIEETTDTSFPDFGSAFGSSEETGIDSTAPFIPPYSKIPAELEETDEFDELLVSLDRSPSPLQAVKQEEISNKKLYDLSVNEEEDEEILDIPVIKDYNSSASGPDSEKSVTSSSEGSVSLDFDDISAVEQELNDLTPDTGDETVVTNDKSTQLLMMIAEELSSIKKELATLKNEIAGYKASGIAPEQPASGSGIEETDNSGFFNDDDTDETIALTGDELNNILITADFTEEKNEEVELPIDTMQVDTLGETAEINFEIPETPLDFNGFSADLDDADVPETLPDSIFEIPELDISIAVEPAHVNKIEDETSYLEGSDLTGTVLDDLAIDEPELEIIDFDDEKLEEPELAEFNIDLSSMDSAFPPEQEVSIPADFETADEVEVETEVKTENKPEPVKAAKVEPAPVSAIAAMPVDLKDEIKSVLAYMDQLLESLPEEKIEEFARSEHFEVYRKLFEELGIS